MVTSSATMRLNIVYRELCLSVVVTPDTTMEELKQLLTKEHGVPESEQRMIWSGKQLEDGRTMADYNIQDECTIHLALRMRGMISTFTDKDASTPCGAYLHLDDADRKQAAVPTADLLAAAQKAGAKPGQGFTFLAQGPMDGGDRAVVCTFLGDLWTRVHGDSGAPGPAHGAAHGAAAAPAPALAPAHGAAAQAGGADTASKRVLRGAGTGGSAGKADDEKPPERKRRAGSGPGGARDLKVVLSGAQMLRLLFGAAHRKAAAFIRSANARVRDSAVRDVAQHKLEELVKLY